MSQCPVGSNFLTYLHRDIAAMGADDIAVIWNNTIDRFQVYQCKPKSGLLDMEGYKRYQPRLIFTVQEPDGSYRPLDSRTLNMIAQAIELSHSIWDVPEHKRVEKLEQYEADQAKRLKEKRLERMKERIHEVAPFYRRKYLGKGPKTFVMSNSLSNKVL